MFTAILFMAFAAGPLGAAERPLGTIESDDAPVPTKTTKSSYTPHEPIVIASDADFASDEWRGSGTESNPYVIHGLSITSSGQCIRISGTSVYFEIRGCMVSSYSSSSSDGIHLDTVVHGTVRDCIIEHHPVGIRLLRSTSCKLTNNTVIDSWQYGLCLDSSSGCTLADNRLSAFGVVIIGSSLSEWLYDSSGNTVNGRAIGYFAGLSNTVIDVSGYGQAIFVDCSDVTVKNGAFSLGSPTFAVEMGYCTNCTLSRNSGSGFYLYTSDGCTLIENTASSGSGYGFFLQSSGGCTLKDNTATGNDIGFYVYDSASSTLRNNAALYSPRGFCLNYSHSNTLRNNAATYNYDGFFLSCSDSNTLTSNTASSNIGYGICTLRSFNNRVYLNKFEGNGQYNAWSSRSSNLWDDGVSSGNYWDDYNDTGTYPIPGLDEDVDHYPFTLDEAPPTIDSPADIQYRGNTAGHSIVWYPADSHPDRYELYRNGLLIDTGDWHGSPVIIGVDGLLVGTYVFTITVYDTCGNWVSDTVLVTVLPPTTTTTTTTNMTAIGFPLSELAAVLAAVEAAAIVLVFVFLGMGRPARGGAKTHGNV